MGGICLRAGGGSEGWHLLFLGLFLSLENDTKAIKEAYEFIFFFLTLNLENVLR